MKSEEVKTITEAQEKRIRKALGWGISETINTLEYLDTIMTESEELVWHIYKFKKEEE